MTEAGALSVAHAPVTTGSSLHAVWDGAGSSRAQSPLVHAVWNGARSGRAQLTLLHAVWTGCTSGTAQPLQLPPSCGGVVTMGSSVAQLLQPGGFAITAPLVPIASAKAAKITSCFMAHEMWID
jgi:hypothetical protein